MAKSDIGFKIDKEKKTLTIFIPKGRWFFVYSYARFYPKSSSDSSQYEEVDK